MSNPPKPAKAGTPAVPVYRVTRAFYANGKLRKVGDYGAIASRSFAAELLAAGKVEGPVERPSRAKSDAKPPVSMDATPPGVASASLAFDDVPPDAESDPAQDEEVA